MTVPEIVDTFSTAIDRAEFVDAIRRTRNSYNTGSIHWQAWDLMLRAAQQTPGAVDRGEIVTREVERIVVVVTADATRRDSPPERPGVHETADTPASIAARCGDRQSSIP